MDDRNAYFGVNGPGGLRAVDVATGKEVWTAPAGERLCGTLRSLALVRPMGVLQLVGVNPKGSRLSLDLFEVGIFFCVHR